MPEMNNQTPLWVSIRRFSRNRPFLAILFLILGIIGVVIPVIPGLLFIFLAIAMFKRGWLSKFRRYFRSWRTNEKNRAGDES
jgi:flagellar biosynthesis component FlhA